MFLFLINTEGGVISDVSCLIKISDVLFFSAKYAGRDGIRCFYF